MWPLSVDWQTLRFGVEIEFVGGDSEAVELLPGWLMTREDHQVDDCGRVSGSELKPPPIRWAERAQIREMLARLRNTGATANWSCGLHVHVGLEPWGEEILHPMLEAALAYQGTLRELLQTTAHRLVYCPPVTAAMKQKHAERPCRAALVQRGRPQSHRCGVNVAAWYDNRTVEIRFANGSVAVGEVMATVELCLRFVAAVGAGRTLPTAPLPFARALGAPTHGYPPPAPAPLWALERVWLENALMPALAPLALAEVAEGEVLSITPTERGILVAVEHDDGDALTKFLYRYGPAGWERVVLGERNA